MPTQYRTRSEEKFAAIEARVHLAMQEQAMLADKRRENTVRLRALRLAKEAADAKAAAEAKAAKLASRTRRSKKASAAQTL